MKRNISFIYLCLFSMSLIFFSCSPATKEVFTKRKYFDFKRGETTVYVLEKPKQERMECNEAAVVNVPLNGAAERLTEADKSLTASIKNERNRLPVKAFSSDLKKSSVPPKWFNTLVDQPVKYHSLEPAKITAQNKVQKKLNFLSKINLSALNVVELILAILLPPIGVLLHEGGLNNKFWIDLLLTLLFFVPGMIYAILVVTDTI